MKDSHLREIVEIVGIISIVAALLLVAREVRESNRIATVQVEMQLNHGLEDLNLRRATSPNLAKLFPKLHAPGSHLVTATEESQIQGIARHLAGIYSAAQVAHDNGLLDVQGLDTYRQDLAQTLERLPGLAPALRNIHDSTPGMSAMPVFEPLRNFEARAAPHAPAGSSTPH